MSRTITGNRRLVCVLAACVSACSTTGDPSVRPGGGDAHDLTRATISTLVGPACDDTESDERHCGGCDVACAPGESCVSGLCAAGSATLAAADAVTPAAPTPPVDLGTWVERGPRIGGRLSSVVVTADGTRMLVASPGGGVWRRDSSAPDPERGALHPWRAPGVSNDGDQTTTHLEWDIDRSTGRLWRVNRNSIQWSTDMGERWTSPINQGAQPNGLLPRRSGSGVRDPRPFAQLDLDDGIVYLAGWGCTGLWYSWDGVSFEEPLLLVPGDPDDENNCVGNIAVDPLSKYVYVTSLHQPLPLESAALFQSLGRWRYRETPPSFFPLTIGACRSSDDCRAGAVCDDQSRCVRTPAMGPAEYESITSNAIPGSVASASRSPGPDVADADHRIVIRNGNVNETYVLHWCGDVGECTDACLTEGQPTRCPLWERFSDPGVMGRCPARC